MRKTVVLLGLLAVFAGWAGCKKKVVSSPIPHIDPQVFYTDSTLEGLNLVHAGYFKDTVKLFFNFTDGDADLGNDQNGTNYDIFMKDSRNDSLIKLFFPEIPSGTLNPGDAMEGTCYLLLDGSYFIPRDSVHMITGDTVSYDVYIKDRAGHESNHFTTPQLLIRP